MSAYRDVEVPPGHAKTKIVFPGVRIPAVFFQIGISAAALGALGVMLHPSRSGPLWTVALGIVTSAISLLGGRSSSMILDRAADALEIHGVDGDRRVHISSIEEVVTDRTRIGVTISLRTKSGEEIPVWSGLALFAGDAVGNVQNALIAPLEEAKDRD